MTTTTGYMVVSNNGSLRLQPAERQRRRYRLVLFAGYAATVFLSRRTAERAIARTLAYRHEMYGTRLDRDRLRFWIVRLGPSWEGPLPAVPPRKSVPTRRSGAT